MILNEFLLGYKTKIFCYDKNKEPYFIDFSEISYHGPRYTKAFRWHRSNTSVESYVFTKYRKTLNYPFLQCLISKGFNGHKNFFPIELCFIIIENYINFIDNFINLLKTKM